MNNHEEPICEVDQDPRLSLKQPYRTTPYWTCWTRCWRNGAGCRPPRRSGMNYRALALCCDSQQVSCRMGHILVDFGSAGDIVREQPAGAGTDRGNPRPNPSPVGGGVGGRLC